MPLDQQTQEQIKDMLEQAFGLRPSSVEINDDVMEATFDIVGEPPPDRSDVESQVHQDADAVQEDLLNRYFSSPKNTEVDAEILGNRREFMADIPSRTNDKLDAAQSENNTAAADAFARIIGSRLGFQGTKGMEHKDPTSFGKDAPEGGMSSQVRIRYGTDSTVVLTGPTGSSNEPLVWAQQVHSTVLKTFNDNADGLEAANQAFKKNFPMHSATPADTELLLWDDSETIKPVIEPAGFIVRSPSYPQNEDYPHACARIVDDLLSRPQGDFSNANEFLGAIGEQLQRMNTHVEDGASYGRFRADSLPRTMFYTDFVQSVGTQNDNITQFRSELARKNARDGTDNQVLGIMHPLKDLGLSELEAPKTGNITEVELSVAIPTSTSEPETVEMIHPRVVHYNETGANNYQAIYESEARWSGISQAFSRAMEAPDPKQAQKHALTMFWMMSHDLPMERGTDTTARIALEYLRAHKGFDPVGLMTEGNSLSRYAQFRTLNDFIEGYEKGEYFDRNATSQSVLEWQQQHLKNRGLEGDMQKQGAAEAPKDSIAHKVNSKDAPVKKQSTSFDTPDHIAHTRYNGGVGAGFGGYNFVNNLRAGDYTGAAIAGADVVVNVASMVTSSGGKELAKKLPIAGHIITAADASYNVYKAPTTIEKVDAAASNGFILTGAAVATAIAAPAITAASLPVAGVVAAGTVVGVAGAHIASTGYEVIKAGVQGASTSLGEMNRFHAREDERHLKSMQYRLHDDLAKRGVMFDESSKIDFGNASYRDAMRAVLDEKMKEIGKWRFVSGDSRSDYDIYFAAKEELDKKEKEILKEQSQSKEKIGAQEQASVKESNMMRAQLAADKLPKNISIGKAECAFNTPAPTIQKVQQSSKSATNIC